MSEPRKIEGLRPWPTGTPGDGETIRPFVGKDWVGGRVRCPCHGVLHTIVEADGPFLGNDLSEGGREDCYWIVRLSDGGDARLWEDRKGVIMRVLP